MLIPRLISGVLLAALAGGVIVGDTHLAPWFPCLFLATILFAGLGAKEMLSLLPAPSRPPVGLAVGGVATVIAANWVIPLQQIWTVPPPGTVDRWFYQPYPVVANWAPPVFAFVFALLASFLWEMSRFREPGHATARLAALVLVVAYLGILPSFLVQLRWTGPDAGTWIALTIFVPKVGDIGAYFTGRAIGRHKMTPTLSPKKTWEGFAGGILASVGIAFLPALWLDRHPPLFAIGFGITVGIAGVLGDLAESLLKRDAGTKDAAKSIPGFGGVLDVIDSVLFAAPVAYAWFTF